MLLVAVDRATDVASVAVFNGTDCLGKWSEEGRGRHQPELAAMTAHALQELRLTSSEIGCFAAGLGPGSFSGVRASLAFLHGAALPSGAPVVGVSSAAAMALLLAGREDAPEQIAIVGDARRGRLWLAEFTRSPEPATAGVAALAPCESIRLVDPDALARELMPGALVASPDWDRIADTLRAAVPKELLLAERAISSAEAVGRLALDAQFPRHEPPLPIYLHPAVRDQHA